jgi:AhpD family alkylhydroperoxidase
MAAVATSANRMTSTSIDSTLSMSPPADGAIAMSARIGHIHRSPGVNEAMKGTEMESRMNHPAMIVPGAMEALQALSKAAAKTGVPFATRKIVELRASQINGCSVCVDMHTRELRKAGESEERIATVAAWRETSWFSEAERAALALTEAVTRLADRPDAVTDDIWHAAAKHYDDVQLGGLLIDIGTINVWNRLNAATRQLAGKYEV